MFVLNYFIYIYNVYIKYVFAHIIWKNKFSIVDTIEANTIFNCDYHNSKSYSIDRSYNYIKIITTTAILILTIMAHVFDISVNFLLLYFFLSFQR